MPALEVVTWENNVCVGFRGRGRERKRQVETEMRQNSSVDGCPCPPLRECQAGSPDLVEQSVPSRLATPTSSGHVYNMCVD